MAGMDYIVLNNGVEMPIQGFGFFKSLMLQYANMSHSNDLIKIGHIDGDGIDALNVGGDIKVKIVKQ